MQTHHFCKWNMALYQPWTAFKTVTSDQNWWSLRRGRDERQRRSIQCWSLQTNWLSIVCSHAEVMLIMNLWTEAGLVNGACGNIVAILKPGNCAKSCVLMVNFPAYHGPALTAQWPTVVSITQVLSQKVKGIPLTLSWVVTIHKSQGMSLDRLTIDLGDKVSLTCGTWLKADFFRCL